MTLQINKANFVHNGDVYDYNDVILLKIHRTTDTLWLRLKSSDEATLEEITIQSEHISALLLAYSRWLLNMV